jgi:hypothetical protein
VIAVLPHEWTGYAFLTAAEADGAVVWQSRYCRNAAKPLTS